MAIDRIDRTVVTREFLVGALPDRGATQRHLPARLGPAVAFDVVRREIEACRADSTAR